MPVALAGPARAAETHFKATALAVSPLEAETRRPKLGPRARSFLGSVGNGKVAVRTLFQDCSLSS